jgi:dipeptidyl aminopeptidase/acylaminoacyl peptidase
MTVKIRIKGVYPLLGLIVFLHTATSIRADGETLQTVAEKSNFKATSRHAEVLDFCQQLTKLSPVVRLGELGTSVEGRKLPLVILADPPISSAQEAAQSKKLVVYAQGNIHAGEVDGKEALLMLARELATAQDRTLLKDLIIVIAPIFNADGNEKISKQNRRSQKGPEEGAGVRQNAQGLDLNRDFVKLESPEVRALVRFFNQWHPAVFIDCHTTNGSHHRYTITYEGGGCPAGDARLIATLRDSLLPDVGRRLEKRSGYQSFYYGNFSRDRSRWETVPATPRYGIHYAGLRNMIGILSESYSYAPYKERVLASRDFVRSICEYLAENKDKVRQLLANARAMEDTKPGGRLVLQHKPVPLPKQFNVLGFVEEEKDGRRIATDQPKEYPLHYWGGSEATLTVQRPYAYLFPATYTKAVETLQRHGIEVEELREDIELDVEAYRIDKVARSVDWQKLPLVSVQASVHKTSRRMPAGTILVKSAQSLGTLASYVLEPQSDDGLGTWGFFDDALKEGSEYAVVRLPESVPVTTGRVRPLREERTFNKPITLEAANGFGSGAGTRGRGRRRGGLGGLDFDGSPVSGLSWLDDGEHFLQVKGGQLLKVHATNGRAQPFYDPEKLAQGLSSLPTMKKDAAASMARSPQLRMNPQRTAALFEYESDLYYCNLDGSGAVRLTKTPGNKELSSFSPNGQFVAFVRDHNLFVVDIATQTERALTSDGTALVSNGKADWVYFEEIFNRNWRAYWWSPDSTQIVFLRLDDGPVHKFTVLDPLPTRQVVEATPYPKAGDPNPFVKLGIVSVGGGQVQFADLSSYSETSSLIIWAGWTPDSQRVCFYVQDRAQTWLDLCTVSPQGGLPTRLFREMTKAWVDDPGPPKFLKDGSFLLASERTGWKHLYHYDKAGKPLGAVTSGPWEITGSAFEPSPLLAVDETEGWVYFTAMRDSPIGTNLYRVHLDGSHLERLTTSAGDHRVNVSPKGNLFIDSCSSHTGPTQVRLYQADGTLARTLDTNPVYAIEEYRFGKYELLQIKMPDGFMIEGSLLKPPGFDPSRRYPVWFKTYAGPHAPTIHDSWSGGQVADQALAQMGFVIFRCDPRSASRKGAASTWTAYRQLGVQELADIEAAIRWLTGHSWVDASRIGMSGHSYGGFMTAYALTHSKLFAAGIAGAPVTDWRNYDSIYTERYMNTPQENPDGYNRTSVVKAAKDLHGKLLILHGLMDDNVHMQNTMQFVQELQRADKDFEMMIYPHSRHGMFGRHYQRLLVDFMRRTLQPEGGSVASSGTAEAKGPVGP